MRWKKLGNIFDLTSAALSDKKFLYAQSPQALVFDEFVRIYFSTRQKDHKGKYVSHIAYADMTKDLRELIGTSEDTVIEVGALGCFDEHGIFPMNVLRDGKRILAYTSGWNRKVSVILDGSIGFAESYDNGKTFRKIGPGPVLTSSLYEPFLVGDPFVQKHHDTYHMWYIYGTRWISNPERNEAERVYKIGHATSADGINWEKEGRNIIPDKINEDECQALPTVISINGRHHMFFCYRHAFNFREDSTMGYRIGYAWSDDLLNWVREDSSAGIDVSAEGWDSEMMCYPHVFSCDDNIYMLYNGNEFGRYGFGVALLEDDLNS
jgi:predicted GH43/DUF377 family glycosyl hydrolase